MTRSIDEERIFRTRLDYEHAISLLAGLVAKNLMVCHEFCVMPTHYHVLATFSEDDAISTALHKLNRSYATGFNKRHCRRGKVFDGPYTSVKVEDDRHLVWLAQYIANNPNERPWPYGSFDAEFPFVDRTLWTDLFGTDERWRSYVANAALNRL